MGSSVYFSIKMSPKDNVATGKLILNKDALRMIIVLIFPEKNK